MVRKGKLAVFESSNISETGKVTPTKIGVHACYINPYLHERENWLFLKVAISPKLERSHPSKLAYMHVTSTPICMNFLSRFRLIKFFDDHGYSPWSERENWLFLKVAISPKPERPCPPKLCAWI